MEITEPFQAQQDNLSFKTEANLKAGLNNDNLLTTDPRGGMGPVEPIENEPFTPQNSSSKTITEPFQAGGMITEPFQPIENDPKQTIVEMGMRQASFIQSPAFEQHFKAYQAQQSQKQENDYQDNATVLEKIGKSIQSTGSIAGLSSTAASAGDFVTSMVGMPMSWITAAQVWQDTGDKDKARAAFETTKEWTSIKTILGHYGVPEKYLNSKNFLDDAMDVINEKIIQPGADKYLGNEDSFAKEIYKDVATVALFASVGGTIAKPLSKTRQFIDKTVTDFSTTSKVSDDAYAKLKANLNPEVDTSNIQSPYMSNKHFEAAQGMADATGEPAYGQMDLVQNKRQVPIIQSKELDKAMSQANRREQAISQMPESMQIKLTPEEKDAARTSVTDEAAFTPDTSLQEDPTTKDRLLNATNLGQALETVRDTSTREEDRGLANHILKLNLPRDIPFSANSELDARGSVTTNGIGAVAVEWNPKVADSSVILHEAAHAYTNDALYAHENGRGSPKQVAYSKAIQEVYDVAKEVVNRRNPEALSRYKDNISNDPIKQVLARIRPKASFDKFFQNLREFNAYGLTDPIFQQYLHTVKMPDGRNAFQKFIQSVKEFFGADKYTDTAFTRLLDLTHEWKFIQDPTASLRGKNIVDFVAKEALARENAVKDYSALADVSPSETPEQVMARFPEESRKDLFFKNAVTTNQIGQLSNNPLAHWSMMKMDQIYRQSYPRFIQYNKILKPFFDLGRKDKITVLKKLVDIQQPEFKDQRAQAEFQNNREQFLEQQGLRSDLIPTAVRILDVMKDVYKKDAEGANTFGRNLGKEPMYFPLVHNGNFVVRVTDSNSRDIHIKGFDSWKEARSYESMLRNTIKPEDGGTVNSVERTPHQSFADDFSILALDHAMDPDFITKGIEGKIRASETAPYSFEKARRDESVGGYVGEFVDSKAEEKRMLSLLEWRMRASHKLELRSRIYAEMKMPMFDSGMLMNTPNLRNFIGYTINRELGMDVSKLKVFDTFLQKEVAENVGKAYSYMGEFVRQIGKDDKLAFDWTNPTVSDYAIKNLFRGWTYLTSFMKLSLNPPIIVSNFATNSIIGLDGVRTAALHNVNPHYALSSLYKTMVYLGGDIGKYLGVKGKLTKDAVWAKETADFLKTATEEGIIQPHQMEDFSAEARTGVGESLTPKALRATEVPRNLVEKFTNYQTAIYYYNFFHDAMPHLEGEALKGKVYEALHSFTGNYNAYAQPLMFSKLGDMGQLMTNFSKWHFNQLGRLMVDIKQVGSKNSNAYSAAMPILMTSLMAVAQAGMYGLPIVVEYEALRKLGQATGAWDIRPLPMWFKQVKNKIDYPDWMDRGLITKASDIMTQYITQGKETSGPDVSGSLRHAGFLEIPTVALSQFYDTMLKTAPAAAKEALARIGFGQGPSFKEIENATQGLPSTVANLVRENIGQLRKQKNGKYAYYDLSQGQKLITLDKFEADMVKLGMETTDTRKDLNAVYAEKWQERQRKKNIAQLVEGTLTALEGSGDIPPDYPTAKRNLKELFLASGPQGLNSVVTQLKQRKMGLAVDFFEREAMNIVRDKSVVREYNRLEQQRKAKQLSR